MFKLFLKSVCALVIMMGFSACDNSDDEIMTSESSNLMIQQIGESMVSLDESSGNSSGTMMVNNPMAIVRTSILEASCNGASFGACGATASATAVKNFNGCTIVGGLVSVSGSVSLTFAGSGANACTMPLVGDSVSRVPAFTASLPGGAGSFAMTALSTGQTLTRTASSTFAFSDSGIRRVYTAGNGSVVADMTTSTTSDISISGTTRTDRVVNGGSIQITDNLNSQSCTVTPNNVAWTSTSCNCPTSGTWTGSCTTNESIAVEYTSTCGRVNSTIGSTSKTLTIDRCSP